VDDRPRAWTLLRAQPLALLALWAMPAAAIAALTVLLGSPAEASAAPTPADAASALARLMGLLYAGLFLVVLFAAPTASLASGAPPLQTLRALGRPAALRVAALMALFLTLALMLTLLPGIMAGFVNPLMSELFLAVGTIGGAAAAIGLFGRWMHAPGLAAVRSMGATEALDASRAEARAQRNFGFALGLSVLLFAFALAGGAASFVAGRAGLGGGARALASWVPLWVGLALVASAVEGRRLQPGARMPAPAAPTLALRSRPTRCPSCGALAAAPSTGPGNVTCPGCGLRASLR
jgi:hypothetical protein